MKHYFFGDKESGEDFLVSARSLDEAKEIAKQFFEKPIFWDTLTEQEAEASGLDEY